MDLIILPFIFLFSRSAMAYRILPNDLKPDNFEAYQTPNPPIAQKINRSSRELDVMLMKNETITKMEKVP